MGRHHIEGSLGQWLRGEHWGPVPASSGLWDLGPGLLPAASPCDVFAKSFLFP